ncbi:MAG TPA: sugar O-acetyltransferase [Erysipelothrix sp.]|nr:sugar O-acetyltransferase [Erysipelothrix sp.]
MKKDYDYDAMLKGELYLARGISKENNADEARALSQRINQLPIGDRDEIVRLEKKLFGSTGENIYVNPPFYIDYGKHIFMGNNVYCNMDCVFLDVNTITIGNNVMLGPRVNLFTAGHPIDADVRISDLEFGLPIVIEDKVWIGGNATILPGVTVGENSIVAAGAVVTKDVPANSIVGGNPARLIRMINEEDKSFWESKSKQYFDNKEKY